MESWFGVDDGIDPAVDNEWPLLPFLALSDGAHLYDCPTFFTVSTARLADTAPEVRRKTSPTSRSVMQLPPQIQRRPSSV